MKTLYLPIEVKNRELEGKTLLAICAARRGYGSVMGSMGMIGRLLPHLHSGTYVSKDIYRRRIHEFERIRGLGHELVSWDEEGLIFRTKEVYLSRSVAGESLEQCSRFFAWGEYQADILRDVVQDSVPLVPVGNPRFDLLRPEHRIRFSAEVEELKKKHGRFVLVNTNFGHANNIKSKSELLEILRSHSTEFTVESERAFHDFVEHDTRMYTSFLEMIPQLADALPAGINIVVRPHPIEKAESYIERFANHPRISVVRDGGVISWLLAAELLVHNSCTTGVESLLLGKPSLAYVPFGDDSWEINLPNTLSVVAEDVGTLCTTAVKIIDGAATNVLEKCESRARTYIASVGGAPACESILDSVDVLASQNTAGSRVSRVASRFLIVLLGTIGPAVKRFIRAILRRKVHAYDAAKFSGLSRDDVLRAVELLGAENEVRVKYLARDVYRIDPVQVN